MTLLPSQGSRRIGHNFSHSGTESNPTGTDMIIVATTKLQWRAPSSQAIMAAIAKSIQNSIFNWERLNCSSERQLIQRYGLPTGCLFGTIALHLGHGCFGFSSISGQRDG